MLLHFAPVRLWDMVDLGTITEPQATNGTHCLSPCLSSKCNIDIWIGSFLEQVPVLIQAPAELEG